jgi:hypothetical protein
MRYRIVEEDRNTETTRLDPADLISSARITGLVSDSGQLINWRYVRRLVPIDPAKPDAETSTENTIHAGSEVKW